MVPLKELLLFAGAALIMVLAPGPNMIIARSICQGRKAGVISLLGVIAGFLTHALNPKIAVFYLSLFFVVYS